MGLEVRNYLRKPVIYGVNHKANTLLKIVITFNNRVCCCYIPLYAQGRHTANYKHGTK
jgi:hypothetical protein